jgi:hypothetical protein
MAFEAGTQGGDAAVGDQRDGLKPEATRLGLDVNVGTGLFAERFSPNVYFPGLTAGAKVHFLPGSKDERNVFGLFESVLTTNDKTAITPYVGLPILTPIGDGRYVFKFEPIFGATVQRSELSFLNRLGAFSERGTVKYDRFGFYAGLNMDLLIPSANVAGATPFVGMNLGLSSFDEKDIEGRSSAGNVFRTHLEPRTNLSILGRIGLDFSNPADRVVRGREGQQLLWR